MALFSPLGLMRVLTTLVDRSLDGGEAASPHEPQKITTKRARNRGRPRLELVSEDSHDTAPRGETE